MRIKIYKMLVLSFILLVIFSICVMNGFVLAIEAKDKEDAKKKADDFYNQALELIQMAKTNQARVLLKKAIELDPESIKINRLYQNIFPYNDIIGYYKERYETNNDDPKWVYLYYRLLAKEDIQKGCEKIREAEKKFSNFVYLQLASCTCDVSDLNWTGALIGLTNIIRREDAPIDAYENILRLYSLSEKKDKLLPVCKEALSRFSDEASIYKICIGYSEDIVSLDEKRQILQKAMERFKSSNQLPEIIFAYARSLNNETEKMSYLEMLWKNYPSNKVSISIFPVLWASYTKNNQKELLNLATAVLQTNRVGEAMMYSNAVDYIIEQWENSSDNIKKLLDSIEVSDFNWQGVLILLESLVKNNFSIEKADSLFPKLIEQISNEPNISKDYLFRTLISYGGNYRLKKNNTKAYEYFKKAADLKASSMSERNWIEYVKLLGELGKKVELMNVSAKCYVFSLNEECYKYNKKYIKDNDFYKAVIGTRRSSYPNPIQFSLKAFDGTEISSSKLSKYNIFYIVYAGTEGIKMMMEQDAEELKNVADNYATYLIIITDIQDEAKDYYEKLGIKVPAVYSPELVGKMQIRGIPSIVILDSQGYILFNKSFNIERKNIIAGYAMKALLSEEKWNK